MWYQSLFQLHSEILLLLNVGDKAGKKFLALKKKKKLTIIIQSGLYLNS